MNKVISVVMPYLAVLFIACMSLVSLPYQMMIEAFVIGVFIVIWLLALTKCEGTEVMRILMFLNTVFLVFFIVLSLLVDDNHILNQVSLICALLIPIDCVGYYLIIKNKPRFSMSYKHSFRTRKKRYF